MASTAITVTIQAKQLSNADMAELVGKPAEKEAAATWLNLISGVKSGNTKGRITVAYGAFSEVYNLGAASGATCVITPTSNLTAGSLGQVLNAPGRDVLAGISQLENYIAGLIAGSYKASVAVNAGSGAFTASYDFGG